MYLVAKYTNVLELEVNQSNTERKSKCCLIPRDLRIKYSPLHPTEEFTHPTTRIRQGRHNTVLTNSGFFLTFLAVEGDRAPPCGDEPWAFSRFPHDPRTFAMGLTIFDIDSNTTLTAALTEPDSQEQDDLIDREQDFTIAI
jgi:hypothetical protein